MLTTVVGIGFCPTEIVATFFLQSLDVAGVKLILVLMISFPFGKQISLSFFYHVRHLVQVGFL